MYFRDLSSALTRPPVEERRTSHPMPHQCRALTGTSRQDPQLLAKGKRKFRIHYGRMLALRESSQHDQGELRFFTLEPHPDGSSLRAIAHSKNYSTSPSCLSEGCGAFGLAPRERSCVCADASCSCRRKTSQLTGSASLKLQRIITGAFVRLCKGRNMLVQRCDTRALSRDDLRHMFSHNWKQRSDCVSSP